MERDNQRLTREAGDDPQPLVSTSLFTLVKKRGEEFRGVWGRHEERVGESTERQAIKRIETQCDGDAEQRFRWIWTSCWPKFAHILLMHATVFSTLSFSFTQPSNFPSIYTDLKSSKILPRSLTTGISVCEKDRDLRQTRGKLPCSNHRRSSSWELIFHQIFDSSSSNLPGFISVKSQKK
jgi:hypothetical protein